MNLLKEIEDKSKQSYDSISSAITEDVKLLLESNAVEDIRIATTLAPRSNIGKLQNLRGEEIERKKFDEKYGLVVHRDELKGLCLNYDLRLLPTRLYKGHLDVAAVQKLKEYATKINIELNDYTLREEFFILAPSESFFLEKIQVVDKDPVLLHRLNNGYYAVIYKWGKNFTFFRSLRGAFHRNSGTQGLFVGIIIFFTLLTLFAIIFPVNYMFSFGETIVSFLIGFVVCLVTALEGDKDRYLEKTWDTNER